MATRLGSKTPRYGKAWNELSSRTQRDWSRKYAEAHARGRTTRASIAAYYYDQKNSYWIPRADKLADRVNDPRYNKNPPKTEEEARAYVLSGGPYNRSRTKKQMEYWGEYNNTLRKRARAEARKQNKKIVTRKELDEYLGPSS